MNSSRRAPPRFSPFPRYILATLIGLLLLPAACQREERPETETRFLMGTLVEITAYPASSITRSAINRAFERMEEIAEQADPYGSQALTDLQNGRPSKLSEDLSRILHTAIAVAEVSSGAFDPTLGKAVRIWGFDRNTPGIPTDDELKGALETVGFRHLSMGPEGVARSSPPGRPLWLELGGVAKGYAVDEAVAVLVKEGIRAGIVNAGGDLRSFGVRPGRGTWRIGVQDPDDAQGLLGVLGVKDGSVATSGDYERYFEEDGIRYHHILDPSTGRPARSGIRSATVIADDCALADALATAAFVMGTVRGLELLEGYEGVEGVLVLDSGELITTTGFGSRIGFERR